MNISQQKQLGFELSSKARPSKKNIIYNEVFNQFSSTILWHSSKYNKALPVSCPYKVKDKLPISQRKQLMARKRRQFIQSGKYNHNQMKRVPNPERILTIHVAIQGWKRVPQKQNKKKYPRLELEMSKLQERRCAW